jgi:hypothetical protein
MSKPVFDNDWCTLVTPENIHVFHEFRSGAHSITFFRFANLFVLRPACLTMTLLKESDDSSR